MVSLDRQMEAGWLYGLVTFAGFIIGGWVWARRFRSTPESFSIFVGAIIGAYSGAKILFLLAEWENVFSDPNWLYLAASGKTIVGALLGGYAGVEIAKRLIGHREATGDWFAVGVPLTIAAGRLGCLKYGCCPGRECGPDFPLAITGADGIPRWPAVPLELAFNLLFVAVILPLVLRPQRLEETALRGQLFHAYLVSYGLFRFWHEFHRDTPKVLGPLSGYHVGALLLICLGSVRGWQRYRETRGIHAAPKI
jgi:phosphatidylglycerol:prolipoprotein diacylglycerol transferase